MQLLERTWRVSSFLGPIAIALVAIAIQPATGRQCTRSKSHSSSPHHPVAVVAVAHRDLADQHYRAKRLDDAAATLRQAAASGQYKPRTAGELLVIASFYEQLGDSLDVGMDPSVPAPRAFAALRFALQLDEMLGGSLADDIRVPLGLVAERAALSYVALRNDPAALDAVELAESLGGTSAATRMVRETIAGR